MPGPTNMNTHIVYATGRDRELRIAHSALVSIVVSALTRDNHGIFFPIFGSEDLQPFFFFVDGL